MNGIIKDDVQRAIQKVLDSYSCDKDRLCEYMADAAEVVFDAIVAASSYTEKEVK